jgi:hypothetical protein
MQEAFEREPHHIASVEVMHGPERIAAAARVR